MQYPTPPPEQIAFVHKMIAFVPEKTSLTKRMSGGSLFLPSRNKRRRRKRLLLQRECHRSREK